jgi:hypothetical protein
MKENYIYQRLKLLSINNPIGFKMHRIESGGTESGIPDIYFECNFLTGWIESKKITIPKKEDTPVKIPWRPGQLKWLNNHYTNATKHAHKFSVPILALCYEIEKEKFIKFISASFKKEYLRHVILSQRIIQPFFQLSVIESFDDVIDYLNLFR